MWLGRSILHFDNALWWIIYVISLLRLECSTGKKIFLSSKDVIYSRAENTFTRLARQSTPPNLPALHPPTLPHTPPHPQTFWLHSYTVSTHPLHLKVWLAQSLGVHDTILYALRGIINEVIFSTCAFYPSYTYWHIVSVSSFFSQWALSGRRYGVTLFEHL